MTPVRLLLSIALCVAPALSAAETIPVVTPASTGAAHPFLTTGADGALLMSWTEPAGDKHAVKFASYANGKWSAPRTIVERGDLFVNWADFPSIVSGGDGSLIAHWLQKSSSGKYSYDVHIATSADGGATWSAPRVLHKDRNPAEHGFVSLVPMKGSSGALWLDGGAMTGHDGDMSLRYAVVGADGEPRGETVIDSRVCECCGTSMVATRSGLVAAYRDRSSGEIRDISVVSMRDGKWSPPRSLRSDGWKIAGCPVNGPQLAASGDRVVAAWFTAAEERPRVFVTFSNDGGATFGVPIRVDEGAPVGRVDALMIDERTALISWMGGKDDATSIRTRTVSVDGTLGPILRVATPGASRGVGFPRMAISQGRVFLAWTEPMPQKRVRMVSMALP